MIRLIVVNLQDWQNLATTADNKCKNLINVLILFKSSLIIQKFGNIIININGEWYLRLKLLAYNDKQCRCKYR